MLRINKRQAVLQKEQKTIMDKVCYPYSAAELQELAEREEWEEE